MIKQVVLIGSLLNIITFAVHIDKPKRISINTLDHIIEEMMAQTGTIAQK